MRSQLEFEKATALSALGLSDLEVSRRTGIPRETVRYWRQGGRANRGLGAPPKPCPICDSDPETLLTDSYVYVLGLYLGDGYVSRHPRTYCLRIFLDAAYPLIVEACRAAVLAVRPQNKVWVGRQKTCRCNVVMAYSNHWPCLLPQIGPGRKHERLIRLAEWQRELVARERRAFIRGLIHSDGCRTVANDRGVSSVRYHFSNKSEDIKDIYCESLDALGVDWTRPSQRDVAVYRKRSTALLDEFVGPKR